MYVVTRATAAIGNPVLLFYVLSGRSLKFSLRVEAFKSEAAVITKQLMHPDRPQKYDGIIIIPLNPLALAPWALHHGPFYNDFPC